MSTRDQAEETIEWDYVYEDIPDTSSSRKLRGNTSLNPIAIIRKEDNKKFKPGDDVLIESGDERNPYVARILDFSFSSKGFMEMSTIWYSRQDDVLGKFRRSDHQSVSHFFFLFLMIDILKFINLIVILLQHELYFTMDVDRNDVDTLVDTCQIVSKNEYLNLQENGQLSSNIYFVRYGYSSQKGKYTEAIDWNSINSKVPSHYEESVKSLLMSLNQRKKRQLSEEAISPAPSNTLKRARKEVVSTTGNDKNSEIPDIIEITDDNKNRAAAAAAISEIPVTVASATTTTLSSKKPRGRPKSKNDNNTPEPGETNEGSHIVSTTTTTKSSKRGPKPKNNTQLESINQINPNDAEAVATAAIAAVASAASIMSERNNLQSSSVGNEKDDIIEVKSTNQRKRTRGDKSNGNTVDIAAAAIEQSAKSSSGNNTRNESKNNSTLMGPPALNIPISSQGTVSGSKSHAGSSSISNTSNSKTPSTSTSDQLPLVVKKSKSLVKPYLQTPTRRIVIKAPVAYTKLPNRPESDIKNETNNNNNNNNIDTQIVADHKTARALLHVSTVPDALPCRDREFSQIFIALEGAIKSETGSCIYISGTPGTGKTATVREVITQLQLRIEDGTPNALPGFTCVEINGMKLINPQEAYDTLWQHMTGHRVSSFNAVGLLEKEFKIPREKSKRPPVVVIIDELDQLITKSQNVVYNFFNWPSLPNSKLIVIAIANTMDLPERTFSNKISSRLGLTRFVFPGYTYEQLQEIITTRLTGHGNLIQKEAIEFAARKVASVSGDARRALDICRRAFEIAELDTEEEDQKNKRLKEDDAISTTTTKGEEESNENDDTTKSSKTLQKDKTQSLLHVVKIKHIKSAIDETTNSAMYIYLQGLPLASKILLSAVLARIRRSGINENPMGDILEEMQRLCKLSKQADKIIEIFYRNGKKIRMVGFLSAVAELVEGGILVQQSIKGERSARIRLAIAEEEIKTAFKNDIDVETML